MPAIPWATYLDARLRIEIGDGRWCDVSRSIAERDRCTEVADLGIITAWNPGGRVLPRGINEAAHVRLAARAAELGLRVTRAVGMSGAEEAWWAEPSLAVGGAAMAAAVALGAEFGQLAIYNWMPATAVLSVIECGGTGRAVSSPVGQRVFTHRPCPLLPDARGLERCAVPDRDPLRSTVADRRAVLLEAVGCDSCALA